MTLLKRINAFLGHIETFLLCLIILLMIAMALLKIILHHLFHTGILWNEVMLQHFTLWLAFLGAAMATGEGRHISIDVLTRLLPKRFLHPIAIIIQFISLIVVIILAYVSLEFVRFERMSGTMLIGSIPIWYAKLIIPVGFLLIAVHYAIRIAMRIIESGGRQWGC